MHYTHLTCFITSTGCLLLCNDRFAFLDWTTQTPPFSATGKMKATNQGGQMRMGNTFSTTEYQYSLNLHCNMLF